MSVWNTPLSASDPENGGLEDMNKASRLGDKRLSIRSSLAREGRSYRRRSLRTASEATATVGTQEYL